MYTDMTETFGYNRRLMWTDFQALGVNAKEFYDALACPMFSAHLGSNQAVGSSISVLNFNFEEYDNNSNFDTTTYRFTPTIAGVYMFIVAVTVALTTSSFIQTFIYKNGASVRYTAKCGNTFTPTAITACQALVKANGTTDYFDARMMAFPNGFSTAQGGTTKSIFQGFRVASII